MFSDSRAFERFESGELGPTKSCPGIPLEGWDRYYSVLQWLEFKRKYRWAGVDWPY